MLVADSIAEVILGEVMTSTDCTFEELTQHLGCYHGRISGSRSTQSAGRLALTQTGGAFITTFKAGAG